ncbi:MAG: PAS domain S-box protein [Deltaproteobacteria bacterium]|nr:PAS domain S-box protein [Deltaproteobacteria bacterium]
MGNPDESEKLRIDRVKKVLHQTPVAIGVTIMNSVILVLVLVGSTPLIRLTIWFSAVLLVNLARIFIQHNFNKKVITPDNVSMHLKIFLFALFISGCVWGSAGIFLLPDSSIAHQVFIAFMLGGMVAGSVGIFASVMEAFYCFSIPIILPISITFFRFEDNIHYAMAIMIILFWFIMLMTAKKLNREVGEFFNLKYENADLISSLENEVSERKSAQEELMRRNNEIEKIVEERTFQLSNVNQQLLEEIEERKEVASALKRSEEKYRELANSLPQIVFEADEKGNITFANRNAFKAFGYDIKEFEKGFNLLQMIAPEDREKASSNINNILRGLKSNGNEYTAVRKDGSTFPVLSHADVIKKDDKVAGVLGVVIDLTQKKIEEKRQKELETRLQRAQKMEALGTLAGGVAHDLNNILSGIVGYPDLILMQLPENSPFKKPVITMQESGKKAAAIVQDLLTLTRRGVMVDKIVNLNDLVREYLESPEHEKLMSYHRDVRVSVDLEDDLLNISGSPVHLSKTIMNLVSNAAEALPEGGKITITTESRYLDQPLRGYDEVAEGDYAVIKISDNGTGISPTDIDRIFEPFFTKKVMGKSGTGLGMTVVWGTVKDHNGYIDVQSILNAGTTFTLFFPVTRAKKPNAATGENLSHYSGKGETVLVVDDIYSQIDIAHAMLKQLGYTVSAVSSGEQAIQYIRHHKTDLVILDMIMQPGIGGLTTYKKILEFNPGQKALIASGYSENRLVNEAITLGAGAYIKKPYTLITLAKAVRMELDRT